MTVLFGGAGSSNAPAEKSKTKNESPEKERLDDVKTGDNMDEKRVKLVRHILNVKHYWMRLSSISRNNQTEVNVILRCQRLRRITLAEITIISGYHV
jgi:hypothetical protein